VPGGGARVNPFAGIIPATAIAAVISLPGVPAGAAAVRGYFTAAILVIAAVFQIAATLSPSVGGTTGVSVPGLAGYSPVLREALTYWATLAVAVRGVAGVYLLAHRTFGLDTRAPGRTRWRWGTRTARSCPPLGRMAEPRRRPSPTVPD
jgi:hypothetical protein